MKNRQWIWKLLRLLGLAPFLFALGFCFVSSILDRGGPLKMTFGDYLIFYSFLYWYTYVIGIALIVLSSVFRRKLS